MDVAYGIAMRFAERELNLPPEEKRSTPKRGLRSAECADLLGRRIRDPHGGAAVQHPDRVVSATWERGERLVAGGGRIDVD
jgi:hypothetical protein